MGSQFGGGFGQGAMGSQFGGGFGGQGAAGSQLGGGFGGQGAVGSQLGAGSEQPAVAQQAAQPVSNQQSMVDTRNTGSDVTSGTAQQYGSSAPVPAAGDSRSASTNTCYNIIDSVFPSFSRYCSVLPQTTFSLPNFFGHNSKDGANDLLNTLRPALESDCFKDIRMFTCPLFFPPCDSDAILPCASFCRAVKNRCNDFDLTAISCDQLPEKSEFCPSIIESNRLIDGNVQDRSTSYNDYGSQARFVNDYPSTSVLTRSSSSYGSADRSAPSSYGSVDRSAPSSSYGSVDRSASSSYGSVDRSAPSSYGSVDRSAPSSSSYGSVDRSAPSSYGSVDRSASSSYGSVDRSAPSSSYGSDRTLGDSSFGSNIKSTGSAYGSAIKSVGPSSYGSDRNIVDSSYGGSAKVAPSTSYGGDRTLGGSSFGSNIKSTGSAYGSAIKSVGPSSYGSDRNIVDSSYGGSAKVAPSTSYGGDRTLGGSSYGNTVKSVGSSYGTAVKSAAPTSYGNGGSYGGGSSYGTAVKSAAPTSYGNGGSYGGGSSYGTAAKSAAPTSYGNGGSYGGGSSYGNSGSYGSSYSEPTYGPPYGIQSTGEYTNYYPEKLDLSQCGPTPTENPCTINGAQFYPIPGYPRCYIQCSLERMYVKPCPNYLVWNSRINVCDWPTIAEYPAGNNNYGSSSYGTSNNNYGSGSSYSYGRKKRSTVERKKRFFPGGLFSDPINFEVPLGPPVPGLIPLPGFPGPIGIPGPLIPPPFFGPPIIPPFGPIPPPIIPPIVPPIAPIPPPILPPPLPPFLPPMIPPLPIPLGGPLLPPLPMSIPATFIPGPPPIFGSPFLGGPFGPFGGPLGGPLGGPFGGPFGGPLGGPLGGPFGPFGGPFGPIGAPFGGPLEPFGGPFGPLGGPFGFEPFFDDPFDSDFGFGGGFPFGDEFYGGFPGPFFEPFPFPGGFDIYDDFGGKGGYGKGGYNKGYDNKGYDNYGKGGYNKGYDNKGYDNYGKGGYNKGYDNKGYDNYGKSGYNKGYDNYGKGGYKKDYDNYGSGDYNKGYGKSYNNKGGYGNSYSDNSYSTSNYKKNGNYQSNSYNGYNDYSPNKKSGYSSNYDSDYSSGDYYRKRRNYDLNVDQDTPLLVQNQERSFPQQSRVLSMNLNKQQTRLPSAPIRHSSPCTGQTAKTNVPHPSDSTKYISCLNEDVYEIMDCPSSLIYNPDIDQCEKVDKSRSICDREEPCLNGGQCYQTSPTTFRCTCRGPWTGERCETPVSSCASNPCGEGNECHTLVASDYKQDYVCTCDGRKSYGLTCGRNTVPNPCLASEQEHEQYYPFAYSAHAYVQCNGDIFYVRPCAGGLFWNQESKICDREETSPARPAEDQPSSYQINYNKHESKLAYNRPTVSLTDQSIDKQQGHRYRNYNPHMISNDQNSYGKAYNQINARKEVPKMQRLFSLPLMREYNRRVQTQKPMVSDQQYDQQRTPFVQQTQERPTLRFMQSSSYRR
ncbi:hypothetical protein I4U23_009924 [Adineta vaga]|nr:hypothetical protein I4U23_009924 [Adineta vaga]